MAFCIISKVYHCLLSLVLLYRDTHYESHSLRSCPKMGAKKFLSFLIISHYILVCNFKNICFLARLTVKIQGFSFIIDENMQYQGVFNHSMKSQRRIAATSGQPNTAHHAAQVCKAANPRKSSRLLGLLGTTASLLLGLSSSLIATHIWVHRSEVCSPIRLVHCTCLLTRPAAPVIDHP